MFYNLYKSPIPIFSAPNEILSYIYGIVSQWGSILGDKALSLAHTAHPLPSSPFRNINIWNSVLPFLFRRYKIILKFFPNPTSEE